MNKKYYFKNYSALANAFSVYNQTGPKTKLNLIDYNVLCMVMSFNDSGQKFYMTNKQIANLTVSCEKTIQTSINRLCKLGLISKENILHSRILTVHQKTVDQFVDEAERKNYILIDNK